MRWKCCKSRVSGLLRPKIDVVGISGDRGLPDSVEKATRNERWSDWAALLGGCYLLRTNLKKTLIELYRARRRSRRWSWRSSDGTLIVGQSLVLETTMQQEASNRLKRNQRTVITALLAGCVLGVAARAIAADPYQAAADLRTQYAADIEKLAEWCDACGMAEQASQTRAAVTPQEPCKIFMPVLPVEVGPPKLPAGSPERLVNWDTRLWQLRRQHATTLYQMARQAVRSRREGLAFELMLAAIQANPDYEPARRLLGYQKFHDQWRTLYELKKLRAGMVFSDKFGWMSKTNLASLRRGSVSRAADGLRPKRTPSSTTTSSRAGTSTRSTTRFGPTTASRRPSVLSGKLENLCRLWQEIFLPYYASEADVAALFEGKGKRAPAPTARRKIVYFRDRDDYVETLKPSFPQVGITAGVYVDQTKKAYFYADAKKNDDRTLYHEATHQLFNELRPVIPNLGGKANFWIIEGIAMLMESLHQEDGYWVIGGFQDERLHAAQVRLLARQVLRPAGRVHQLPPRPIPERPAHRHALQPGGRADALPGLLRRRPLPRRLDVVLAGDLHRQRRPRNAREADRRGLQDPRREVSGVHGKERAAAAGF